MAARPARAKGRACRCVCNVRGQGQKANKNDQLDADDLSERLRLGALKPVWHGSPAIGTLKELVRCYDNLVDDSTRVMLRLKAIYRGRAIATSGKAVYRPSQRRAWLAKLPTRGARARAESLFRQLDTLTTLRHATRRAMIAEARRQPGWKTLRSIPFFGPVRVAMLLAVIGTPHRFRTRRQFWPYVGLAVVTRSSGEGEFVDGKLRRKRRAPLTRGLNANHNRMLKDVFKGAANAAAAKAGPLKDLFDRCVAGGVRPTMAKLTLARKLAAIVLRLWKKGELWDPEKLTMQPT